ncbi:MAG: 3-phosphoshikimate 1-carboxyvinyltransferase [Treponema sp.]|jgi:3-phosphoshikimate 1-carboxyvinyltransferase|nr:3-phosphoshikimate 1-carboxyvinyltransferase [Treponema sp.]
MYSISTKQSLQGDLTIPGSKSHTIRAALMAALAEGTSVIHNPLASEDCLSAVRAARTFGAEVIEEKGRWIVTGFGSRIKVPDDVVDCGNSGTTTVFVMALAALCQGYTVVTGDYQIRRRPVLQMVDALRELGAEAFLTRPGQDAPPAVIGGVMKGGTAHFPGLTSPVISAVLMAGAAGPADVTVEVAEPREVPYIQMTIGWMRRYGVTLAEQSPDYRHFRVAGGQTYRAVESTVPGDWSAAAFPLVAAVCTPSELAVSGVDLADVQGDKAVVDHLISMGADITKDASGGVLLVRGGKSLKGGAVISLKDIPDALPALSAAACYARGDTVFTGLAHVRLKETDRVAVMERELTKLGAWIETTGDALIVHGGIPLTGAEVESHNDHRVAMALTVAGLFSQGTTRVKDAECAAVSFPGFFELMNSAGAHIDISGE